MNFCRAVTNAQKVTKPRVTRAGRKLTPSKLAASLGLALGLALAPTQGWAQETAATMPIADLHFHPVLPGNKTPSDFRTAFDRSGVRWFGLGAVGPVDALPAFSRVFGDRLIIWAGQQGMDQIWLKGGMAQLENPDNPDFKSLVANIGTAMGDGRVVGIGELFVNNVHTSPNAALARKMTIDGPVIRTLFELAAKNNAFVAFHMEGEPNSIAQLERLADSNLNGRIILNHCGIYLTPAQLDRLFSAHPNLFCEFAVRYPPVLRNAGGPAEMFNGQTIAPGWRDVFIKHADRFMVGTDANGDNALYVASIQNVRSGLLANLPIDVAHKIAYGNAQALFHLR